MNIEPIVLSGRHVRLEPLSFDHLPGLCEAGLEDEIWRWMPVRIRTRQDMSLFVEEALMAQKQGTALPFATLDATRGEVAGSTRYMNVDRANRRVEIGATWIGREWRRTALNTEAKYLMLRHAFETLACVRVELKTDSLNQRSRNAILRIGAKEEGTLRNHMIMPGGRLRHSVYYGITFDEWPGIKAALLGRLDR